MAVFAHQDIAVSWQESNLEINAYVGDPTSLQLSIIEAYSSTINDFIREINPNKKVSIHFYEDYCYSGKNSFKVSYGKSLSKEDELLMFLSTKYLKITPLLKIIEFGLTNTELFVKNQTSTFKLGYQSSEKDKKQEKISSMFPTHDINVLNEKILMNVLEREISSIQKKYISQPIKIKGFSDSELQFYLQNDSIQVFHKNKIKLLSIPTIDRISYQEDTLSWFLFDTNNSFYFIDNVYSTTQRRYNLSFEIDCLEDASISFLSRTKTEISNRKN